MARSPRRCPSVGGGRRGWVRGEDAEASRARPSSVDIGTGELGPLAPGEPLWGCEPRLPIIGVGLSAVEVTTRCPWRAFRETTVAQEVSWGSGDGIVVASAGKRDGKWVPRDTEARPGPTTSVLRGGGPGTGGGVEEELVSGEHRRKELRDLSANFV